ncbi:putative anaphase-promoting complex subunit ApcB [Paratrimastix pyriformis]|uniref:Anaphase-promoting complex subunit ApcB n=1 Tax=Paratrimastix pyriformis TaxID=342808 RepID=A0ABQ8UM64_9EUKA|nr:putative anaphase-promoting complex subunit ApcB [Paratrimastix pyriformis]
MLPHPTPTIRATCVFTTSTLLFYFVVHKIRLVFFGKFRARFAAHFPPEKIQKPCVSSYNLLMVLFFTFNEAVVALSNPEWAFQPSKYFADRCMNHIIPWLLFFQYSLMFAHYVNEFANIRQHSKKDQAVMCVHHLTTLLLLGFSYLYNYHRAGFVVMVLHDPSDIFLETSKLIWYACYPNHSRATDWGFLIFAAVFFVLRLVLYPILILYPATMVPDKPTNGYIVLTCVYLLFVLNLMWGAIIFRMRLMQGSKNSNAPVLFSLLRDEIGRYVVETAASEWEQQILPSLLARIDETMSPILRQLFSLDESQRTQWDLILKDTLLRAFIQLRTNELFSIIVEFPASRPALLDLRQAIATATAASATAADAEIQYSAIRRDIIRCISDEVATRLLHPGASTADIVQQYLTTIKALRVLDPTNVIVDAVIPDIRAYLRRRPDTVHVVLEFMFDDAHWTEVVGGPEAPPRGDVLADVPEGAGARELAALDQWLLEEWVPDPVDADPGHPGQGTLVELLVSIYGTASVFAEQFRAMLAQRILRLGSYDVENEVADLEQAKIKLGCPEGLFAKCEAMLWDVATSKRHDTSIHEVIARDREAAQARRQGAQQLNAFLANTPRRTSSPAPSGMMCGALGQPALQAARAIAQQVVMGAPSANLRTPASRRPPAQATPAPQVQGRGGSAAALERAEENAVHALIVSHLMWPPRFEQAARAAPPGLRLPPAIQSMLAEYGAAFGRLKSPRQLKWHGALGVAHIEVDVAGETRSFAVTPLQAALVMAFDEDPRDDVELTLGELSQKLAAPERLVRKALAFWQTQGVLTEHNGIVAPVGPPGGSAPGTSPAPSSLAPPATPAASPVAPSPMGLHHLPHPASVVLTASAPPVPVPRLRPRLLAQGRPGQGASSEPPEGSTLHLRQLFGQKALEVLQTFKTMSLEPLHRYLKRFCAPMQYDKWVPNKEKLSEVLGAMVLEGKIALREGSYSKDPNTEDALKLNSIPPTHISTVVRHAPTRRGGSSLHGRNPTVHEKHPPLAPPPADFDPAACRKRIRRPKADPAASTPPLTGDAAPPVAGAAALPAITAARRQTRSSRLDAPDAPAVPEATSSYAPLAAAAPAASAAHAAALGATSAPGEEVDQVLAPSGGSQLVSPRLGPAASAPGESTTPQGDAEAPAPTRVPTRVAVPPRRAGRKRTQHPTPPKRRSTRHPQPAGRRLGLRSLHDDEGAADGEEAAATTTEGPESSREDETQSVTSGASGAESDPDRDGPAAGNAEEPHKRPRAARGSAAHPRVPGYHQPHPKLLHAADLPAPDGTLAASEGPLSPLPAAPHTPTRGLSGGAAGHPSTPGTLLRTPTRPAGALATPGGGGGAAGEDGGDSDEFPRLATFEGAFGLPEEGGLMPTTPLPHSLAMHPATPLPASSAPGQLLESPPPSARSDRFSSALQSPVTQALFSALEASPLGQGPMSPSGALEGAGFSFFAATDGYDPCATPTSLGRSRLMVGSALRSGATPSSAAEGRRSAVQAEAEEAAGTEDLFMTPVTGRAKTTDLLSPGFSIFGASPMPCGSPLSALRATPAPLSSPFAVPTPLAPLGSPMPPQPPRNPAATPVELSPSIRTARRRLDLAAATDEASPIAPVRSSRAAHGGPPSPLGTAAGQAPAPSSPSTGPRPCLIAPSSPEEMGPLDRFLLECHPAHFVGAPHALGLVGAPPQPPSPVAVAVPAQGPAEEPVAPSPVDSPPRILCARRWPRLLDSVVQELVGLAKGQQAAQQQPSQQPEDVAHPADTLQERRRLMPRRLFGGAALAASAPAPGTPQSPGVASPVALTPASTPQTVVLSICRPSPPSAGASPPATTSLLGADAEGASTPLTTIDQALPTPSSVVVLQAAGPALEKGLDSSPLVMSPEGGPAGMGMPLIPPSPGGFTKGDWMSPAPEPVAFEAAWATPEKASRFFTTPVKGAAFSSAVDTPERLEMLGAKGAAMLTQRQADLLDL